jgi:hypothetical protein
MLKSNINPVGLLAEWNRNKIATAVTALSAVITVSLCPASIQAQEVTAGGKGVSHSDAGESSAVFSFHGSVGAAANANPDSPGTLIATGAINFVIRGAFATGNGADVVHLRGEVLSADVAEDPETVVLYGRLQEVDHAQGEGVVFSVEDNFYIVVGCDLPEGTFVLQWCELPEFPVEVIAGQLKME